MAALERKPASQSGDSTSAQQELINRFISRKHARIKPGNPSEAKEDLSVSSTRIGDYLLTESLALIFLNQGKSDKAIEIYKKLIWKFPQKKAYFASQIEKLKRG